MRALLDDAALVEDDDAVGAAHRREAVGDDERRAALHQVREGAGDERLGLGVELRGRLVEDQDRGVLVDRPRDREPLALAAREPGAALPDRASRSPAAAAR